MGIVVLAAGILIAGGGWENIMGTIRTNHPQMLEPLSGGTMPVSLYFTQWLLVGIFTFALPQSVVRCMGYKDTKSLRGAMIGGTIIIGAMMIGVTTLGVLSAGVLTGDLASYGGSVDNIIPRTIVETLPPWLAGVAIVGPVAASISTVSSLLIASSSAIIKDLWLHYADDRGQQVSDAVVARSSQIITLGVGVIVFVLAVVPPSVIWKINMFAFGGLETAFCWVLVGALFFRRANKVGAIASMVGGLLPVHGAWLQAVRPAPNRDRHHRVASVHGDWLMDRQSSRKCRRRDRRRRDARSVLPRGVRGAWLIILPKRRARSSLSCGLVSFRGVRLFGSALSLDFVENLYDGIA